MARILLNFKILIFVALMVSFTELYASPCCGQSSSSLSVMSLRQKMNLTLTQTHASSLGRIYDNSDEFYVWQNGRSRVMDITQLTASYKLVERWQSFINFSYQQGEFENQGFTEQDNHMMDTLVGVTYELMPEYTYSPYKPTVYVSLISNLPTGRSVFDGSSKSENIGVTGHDQWGLGVGLTFQKIVLPWSLLLQLKTLRLFAEDFDQSSVQGFFDSSAQLMLSYNLSFWDLTLNFGVTQFELSSRKVDLNQGSSSLTVPNSRSTTLSFGLSHSLNENLLLTANFSDQTLLGQPKNTLLNQTVGLGLSYNYF